MAINAEIVTTDDGKKIVKINSIIFKGRRNINWHDVEAYLRQFIGQTFEIYDSEEFVYIGADFPDEYAHSKYTARLRGKVSKAKANAAQGIPEIIGIATDKKHEENRKAKHRNEAHYGWYRYKSYFALPTFSESGVLEHYNIFQATLLMRHSRDGKMYLYDVTEIKKETGVLFGSEDLTQ